MEARRPIVISYSHSYPVNSVTDAVCGQRLIVKLEEGGQYEAKAMMMPNLNAGRGESLGYCIFNLVDKRTGRPVPPTTLGCDTAP